MESVLEEYRSSLADLTFNSKPLINMLTVLAEENYSYAPDLVKIIEDQVFQSPPNRRLPVLYLVDSIAKTYGPYVKLFSPNLIKVFLFVFEKAEAKVRHDLYKLRSTWNGMFSKSLLHDLDVAVKQFDPNWPIRVKKSGHPSGLTVEERVAAMVSHRSARKSPSKFSSDEDEYNASYQEENNDSNSPNNGGDILVEEEEILVDDEKYDELEALEKVLLKKKEELSQLEYLEDKPGTSTHDKTSVKMSPEIFTSKMSPEIFTSHAMQVPYFIDASGHTQPKEIPLPDNSPAESPRKPGELEGTTPEEVKKTPIEEDEQLRIGPSCNATPENLLYISEKKDRQSQTEVVVTKDEESQIVIDVQDQTTQYRYRKKTKNFLSQYRVPSKSVATYFRVKTKEAQTQYSPPTVNQDVSADSTSSHPDGGNGVFSTKERSALKEYVAALKDDFLPARYSKHSGLLLRNLAAQRRQGVLCDITLGAEGRVFKAHKSVLAASSDFFYTLFAHEEMEKTPLSHIELQGITAKALNLVLDYIYTSVLPISSLSSVEEIIIAAKRLQIHSLITTCPALEQAVAKKLDMAGWLISNSSLLCPSNKHPYVEALRSVRDLEYSSSFMSSGDNRFNKVLGAGDASTGDFICHADRDTSSRKRVSESTTYDPYSNDEGKSKKRKLKHYTDRSETESDFEVDGSIKMEGAKKDDKYDTGVVASPGMPPTSWPEMYSPGKGKGKKKKTTDAQTTREQAVYKCNNCNRHIISRRNYIAHCDAHLRKGEKPYGCAICKKMFWKESVLESHLIKIHPELLPEQIEQLTKSKTTSLSTQEVQKRREQYSPSSSKQKKRKCPECNVILQNEVAFARHMRIRHPEYPLSKDYKYQCKYCHQYFKTASARGVHIKMHLKQDADVPLKSKKRKHSGDGDPTADGDEDVSSDNNEPMYSSNDEEDGGGGLRQHQNISPADSQDSESAIKLKLYQCEICGEMFSIQCFYKAHMAGHKKDMEDY